MSRLWPAFLSIYRYCFILGPLVVLGGFARWLFPSVVGSETGLVLMGVGALMCLAAPMIRRAAVWGMFGPDVARLVYRSLARGRRIDLWIIPDRPEDLRNTDPAPDAPVYHWP